MTQLSKNHIKSILKIRDASSHKGTHGHSFIIAGSEGKMGAAVIAAKACLRSGTGLLSVSVLLEERYILQTVIPEAMLIMRENKNYNSKDFSAIAIGPGIGTKKDAEEILIHVLDGHGIPLVLDADALNIISADKKLLSQIPKGSVLTPHPKEFERLFGIQKNSEERINTAIIKAKEYGIVIVLKGNNTLITHNGESFINTTGNAGLAKGGSGDALTGIITAFLAQGYDSFNASKLGVYLHGLAADITLNEQSMESMLITDVIENIGKAFKEIRC